MIIIKPKIKNKKIKNIINLRVVTIKIIKI
jgi:hypothetical protein